MRLVGRGLLSSYVILFPRPPGTGGVNQELQELQKFEKAEIDASKATLILLAEPATNYILRLQSRPPNRPRSSAPLIEGLTDIFSRQHPRRTCLGPPITSPPQSTMARCSFG
jgi:hypothetical protein